MNSPNELFRLLMLLLLLAVGNGPRSGYPLFMCTQLFYSTHSLSTVPSSISVDTTGITWRQVVEVDEEEDQTELESRVESSQVPKRVGCCSRGLTPLLIISKQMQESFPVRLSVKTLEPPVRRTQEGVDLKRLAWRHLF